MLPLGYFHGPCLRRDHDDLSDPCSIDAEDYLKLVERICRRCRRHLEAQEQPEARPEARREAELAKRGIAGFYWRLRELTQDPYSWEYLWSYEPYAAAQEHVLYTVLDGWRRGRPTEKHRELYRRFFELELVLPGDPRFDIPEGLSADASSPEWTAWVEKTRKIMREDREVFKGVFYHKRKGR